MFAIAGSVPRIQWLISPHRWLYTFAIFTSVDLICYDMNMGKDRFQKHKKCLIDKGYIIIQKYATAEGKFTNNLYVKKNTVMREAKATDDKATAIELPLPDFTAEAIPAPL